MTGRVVVLPMAPAHLAATMEHEEELFGTESWTADSYRAELADRRHRHYIVAVREDAGADGDGAEADGADGDGHGAVLGWAGLLVIADTAQIVTIGVVRSAQRHGVGQILLDALLAEASRRGAGEVILEVRVDNGPARRLYERNRFTQLRIRRGYYDLGRVDALEMRRAL